MICVWACAPGLPPAPTSVAPVPCQPSQPLSKVKNQIARTGSAKEVDLVDLDINADGHGAILGVIAQKRSMGISPVLNAEVDDLRMGVRTGIAAGSHERSASSVPAFPAIVEGEESDCEDRECQRS